MLEKQRHQPSTQTTRFAAMQQVAQERDSMRPPLLGSRCQSQIAVNVICAIIYH